MKKEKISTVIFRRMLLTACFSLLCGVTGTAASRSGDRMLAVLSLALAGSCVFQTASDCLAAKKGKIKAVKGVCTEVSPAFYKFRKITIMDCEGKEIKVRLRKNVRLIPRESYRLYFRKTDTAQFGVGYVDVLLPVESFWGWRAD